MNDFHRGGGSRVGGAYEVWGEASGLKSVRCRWVMMIIDGTSASECPEYTDRLIHLQFPGRLTTYKDELLGNQ